MKAMKTANISCSWSKQVSARDWCIFLVSRFLPRDALVFHLMAKWNGRLPFRGVQVAIRARCSWPSRWRWKRRRWPERRSASTCRWCWRLWCAAARLEIGRTSSSSSLGRRALAIPATHGVVEFRQCHSDPVDRNIKGTFVGTLSTRLWKSSRPNFFFSWSIDSSFTILDIVIPVPSCGSCCSQSMDNIQWTSSDVSPTSSTVNENF